MSIHTLKIEDRRRQIVSMSAQSMTQEEMASKLGVDRTTVSKDITALNEMSRQFIYDLAHSDLAHCYKQCIDGVEEAKRQAWELFRSGKLTPKDKLAALKLIVECNESSFNLLKDGPTVMNLTELQARVSKFELKQDR
jgi:transcriptional regulator with XRE-family HTH domain